MKKQEHIDELISKSLNKEEAEFYNQLDEQNFPEMIFDLYKGKLGWLTAIMSIMMVVIFAAGVYCAIQFFAVESTQDMLKWALGIIISFSAIAMLKLYSFIQMFTNKLSREIRRLEFQITILANQKES